MRILLITSAYNSLTQRVHAELTDRGGCGHLGDHVTDDEYGRRA
jgi:hypothetical protein